MTRRTRVSLSWLRDIVPEPGLARRLAALTLVQSLGTGAFLTASVPLLVEVAGLDPAAVGWGLSLAGACGFAVSVPAGRLADRRGSRGPLTLLYGAVGILFAVYGFVASFSIFVVVAALVAACEAAISPIRSALVYFVFTGDKAPLVRAQMRSAFNLGFVLGAAGAGVALTYGTRSAFIVVGFVTAGAHFACMLIAWSLKASEDHGPKSRPRPQAVTVLRNPRLLAVALVNGLLELHGTVITVGIPIWLVTATVAAPGVLSAIMVLNAICVVLLQVRFGRDARTVADGVRLQRNAGLVLGLAALVLGSSGFPSSATVAAMLLLAGTLVLTLGEMSQTAGGYTLSYELPPAGRQGEYQGVFSTGRNLRQSLGPGLVASTVVGLGATGWLLLGVGFAVLGLISGPLVRSAKHAVAEKETTP